MQRLFRVTLEAVLIYGATVRTLSKTLDSKLDETYTRLMGTMVSISWRQYQSKSQLYGSSTILCQSGMHFAEQELTIDLLLWTPSQRARWVGRRTTTYIDQVY